MVVYLCSNRLQEAKGWSELGLRRLRTDSGSQGCVFMLLASGLSCHHGQSWRQSWQQIWAKWQSQFGFVTFVTLCQWHISKINLRHSPGIGPGCVPLNLLSSRICKKITELQSTAFNCRRKSLRINYSLLNDSHCKFSQIYTLHNYRYGNMVGPGRWHGSMPLIPCQQASMLSACW